MSYETSYETRLAANVNADYVINYINLDYIHWLGYDPEEIIGQPAKKLRVSDTPELVHATIQEQMKKNHPVHMPVKEVKKNGETYWAEMAIQPIYDHGEFHGYTSIKRLISDPTEIQNCERLYQDLAADKLVYTNNMWASKTKHRWLSRFGLQEASLLTKTVLGLSLLSMILILIAFLMYQNDKVALEERSLALDAKNMQELIKNKTINKEKIGKTNAIALASMSNITELAANRNQAELLELLKSVKQQYQKYSNLKNVKLHFIDENGFSYLKSWLPEDKQKIVDFKNRSYVQKMLKERQPLYAKFVGSVGYNIKSIIPIFHQGRFEGFVEFIQGMGSVQRDFQAENRSYLVAISKNTLLSGGKFQKMNADNTPVSGDGLWVVGNNQQFSMTTNGAQIEALRSLDFESLVNNGYLLSKDFFHAAIPIYGNNQQLIGYHVLSEDAKYIQSFMDENTQVALENFYHTVATILIVILIANLLSWWMVLRPLKQTQQTILSSLDKTGLFARVKHYSKDEIGKLGMAYNMQATMAQSIVAEANAAMEELLEGRLNYRIKSPFEADYDMLKNRINETSETLEKTFNTLSTMMLSMQKGDFQAKIEHNLKGEFGKIVEINQQTVQQLYSVFSEINQVMALTARGKLDERIQNLQEGDVLELQNNINQSLNLLQTGFEDVIRASERIAEGDLTQPISRQYEYALGQAKTAINNSIDSLNQTLKGVRASAMDVVQNVQSVSEGTLNLNNRTQDQAASLEKTSAAMEQTTAQIRSNLENTQTATHLAQEQGQLLGEANKVMVETKHSMQDIRQASEQILAITDLIDSIAFQTNLLALNAAVEAARAGEHGRGFAVVAGEVRSLAGKSADATKQISELIEKTSQAVNVGVKQVDRVGDSLEKVTHTTEQLEEIIHGVNKSSEEQTSGVEEVNRSISTIDQATQQNAALVEETSATTEDMRHAAESMQQAIQTFKTR